MFYYKKFSFFFAARKPLRRSVAQHCFWYFERSS